MASRPPAVNDFSSAPDLGILTEMPIPARVSHRLMQVRLIYYKRLRQPLLFLIMGVLIWVVSAAPRQAISEPWLDALLVVVLVAFAVVFGLVVRGLTPLTVRAILGKPVFGAAGGLEKGLFKATIRAAPDVHLSFTDEDEEMLVQMRNVDNEVTPAIMRHAYVSTRGERARDSSDRNDDWDQVWLRIQNQPIEGIGVSFQQFRTRYPDALRFIPYWLWSSLASLALLDVYVPIVAWLSYQSSVGSDAAVTIIALDVLVSFTLALSVFVVRAYGGSEIQLFVPDREALVDMGVSDEATLDQVDEFRGKSVRPRGVRLGHRYLHQLRNFVLRALVVDILFRAVAIGALVGVSFVFGALLSGEWKQLGADYLSLLYVFAGAVLGLVCGYYVAALVVQNPRSVVTPLVAGAISAGVPLLGQYVITGTLGENPGAVAVALLIGLFTVVGTVVGEMVKSSLERKERSGSGLAR